MNSPSSQRVISGCRGAAAIWTVFALSACVGMPGAPAVAYNPTGACPEQGQSQQETMCRLADAQEGAIESGTLDPAQVEELRRNAAEFREHCGETVSPEVYSVIDGCIARIDAAVSRHMAYKEERIARARPLVPRVENDPEYRRLVDNGYFEDKKEYELAQSRLDAHPTSATLTEEYNVKRSRFLRKREQMQRVLARIGMGEQEAAWLNLW